jgi:hypothetical protein
VADLPVTARTDAGMWLLWQPEAFSTVHDYDSWAVELEDDADILGHIDRGDCVPINIGHDMAAAFVVRAAGPAGVAVLTDRESAYLVATSEPYLFVSEGSVALSGIEHAGVEPSGEVELSPGRWAVTVHLISWDDEPGMKVDGRPAPDALPDFVVLLNPANELQQFRTELATFVRA